SGQHPLLRATTAPDFGNRRGRYRALIRGRRRPAAARGWARRAPAVVVAGLVSFSRAALKIDRRPLSSVSTAAIGADCPRGLRRKVTHSVANWLLCGIFPEQQRKSAESRYRRSRSRVRLDRLDQQFAQASGARADFQEGLCAHTPAA